MKTVKMAGIVTLLFFKTQNYSILHTAQPLRENFISLLRVHFIINAHFQTEKLYFAGKK